MIPEIRSSFPFSDSIRAIAITLTVMLGILLTPSSARTQIFRGDEDPDRPRKAAKIVLHETISGFVALMIERKFDQAIADGAKVIILDIHSPGGEVPATFHLVDMVLEAKDVETVALIEKDAISGAAILSLACDRILIRKDARIGDAGEIVKGADGAYRYTEAKSRSVLAQKVRDVAQATGRPLALAEKLVDKDLVVFTIKNKADGTERFVTDREWESMPDQAAWQRGLPVREGGKEMFFTVNGARAVELGFANNNFTDPDDAAEILNVQTPIPVYQRTTQDTVIWVLNTDVMAFVLIVLGLGALLFEASAPGIGIGGLTSTLCFSLFFWSRFLGGTSGWFEVTLFVVGLIFIALEVFVIPGFGIPGISGACLLIASLVMASRRGFLGEGADRWTNLGWDIATVLAAMIVFIIAFASLATYLGRVPGFGRLALSPPSGGSTIVIEDGAQPAGVFGSTGMTGPNNAVPLWERVQVGEVGRTESPLRPVGRIWIQDELLDVTTEGNYVDSETDVKVVAKRGNQIIVRPIHS
ncbi:MAG: NfeD family protein [Planctomycetota bacterium]